MFIDLHLRSPANARISVSNSPARLGLELNPRDGEMGPAATFAEAVVVIAPAPDSPVPDGFTVEGYARTFEANVLILATRGDEVLVRQFATSADWADTWGEFSTELTVSAGSANLFVGEESPQDGSLSGVTLKITVR
jgi:hypothetical protein